MDTHTLQTFVAVAETCSFSLAAERLYLTQPAVSKRVASLEEELHVRLFERLGRKVLLSEAGRALLPKAKQILLEMEDSKRLIANLSSEVSGTLQLAISHHVGLHRMPDILREFSRRYPAVEFDLHFMNSEEGYEAVASGELELAIVTLPRYQLDSLQTTVIWDDPLVIMAGTAHPLAGTAITAKMLSAYPAILPEKNTVTRQMIENQLHAHGIELRIGVQTNYLETIKMLVSVGLGWSILPLSMFSEDLVTLEVDDLFFNRELGLVTHSRRNLSTAANALCELLRNDCK